MLCAGVALLRRLYIPTKGFSFISLYSLPYLQQRSQIIRSFRRPLFRGGLVPPVSLGIALRKSLAPGVELPQGVLGRRLPPFRARLNFPFVRGGRGFAISARRFLTTRDQAGR